jgi:cytochrome c1
MRRLERERQRQIERERKEREAKERAERAKEKAKKGGKSKKTKKPAKKRDAMGVTPPMATGGSSASAAPASDTASVATPRPEVPAAKGRVPSPDERAFELEEGARVQASIRIENPYGRGKRPLLFHTVWLNPEGKRVFKKMTEWTPNDTSQVLTTSLTISPAKRTAGRYGLQVFLFRELIAEKSIQLTGTSTAQQEKDDAGGM